MYLSLPSDACGDVFETNKVGHYKTQLAHEIALSDGKYEAALSSLHWPHTHHNVQGFRLTLKVPDPPNPLIWLHGLVDSQRCDDVEALLNELNRVLLSITGTWEVTATPQVYFETRGGKVGFFKTDTAIRDTYTVKLPKRIGVKLGYAGLEPVFWVMTGTLAPRSPDLNGDYATMELRCDLIQPTRIMGDKFEPVLAVIPLQGAYGGRVFHEVEHREYFPIRLGHVKEIELQLVDSAGDTMRFNAGRVTADIHIKRAA